MASWIYPGFNGCFGPHYFPDGSQWAWVLVKLVALGVKTPIVAADGSRRAPAGVPVASVNWLCTPPESVSQWEPDAVEVASLIPGGYRSGQPSGCQPRGSDYQHSRVGRRLCPTSSFGPSPGWCRRSCGTGSSRGCRAGASRRKPRRWRCHESQGVERGHTATAVLSTFLQERCQERFQEIKEGQEEEESKVLQKEGQETFKEVQTITQFEQLKAAAPVARGAGRQVRAAPAAATALFDGRRMARTRR